MFSHVLGLTVSVIINTDMLTARCNESDIAYFALFVEFYIKKASEKVTRYWRFSSN